MAATDLHLSELMDLSDAPRRRFGRRPRPSRFQEPQPVAEVPSVDAEVEAPQEPSEEETVLAQHLAGLLSRFAEAVTAEELEANRTAARIVADAEARAATIENEARTLLAEARDVAAATFAEAGRRYEQAMAARREATERLDSAIERISQTMAALQAVPTFPELELPVPVSADTGVMWSFDALPPSAAPRAEEPPVVAHLDEEAAFSAWLDLA